MIVSVYGQTEKRPVIYTLMKLLQHLGDVCLISDDRHFKRLVEDETNEGHYQNIFVTVTDSQPDEVFDEIEHNPSDFEHIIFDGSVPENADLVIFVTGMVITEAEQEFVEYLDNYKTIALGFGKNCIPYTIQMFKNLELIESKKMLREVDKKLTQQLATMLAEPLKMSASNICKVVRK